MMNEAIERARKRAQAASSRHPGSFASSSSSHNPHYHGHPPSYQSPLGAGFTFDRNRPRSEQMNPYSIKGKRQRQQQQHQQSRNEDDDVKKGNTTDEDDDDHGDFRILYEESHFNMNGGWSFPSSSSGSGFGGSVGGYSGMERMRGGKEYVVERMKNRRKYRVRERGEPNPYHHHVRHNHYGNYNNREGVVGKNNKKDGGAEEGSVASGCSIM